MLPRQHRIALADISNLSPLQTASSSLQEASPRKLSSPGSKSLKSHFSSGAEGLLLQASASPCNFERRGHEQEESTTMESSQACQTPLIAGPSMDIDSITPHNKGLEGPNSCSAEREDFIIYSRRKSSVPSYLINSCPPLQHHLRERNTVEPKEIRKPAKRGFSMAILDKDAETENRSTRRRRHSLPAIQRKKWLPEEFVSAQRSHFAEVDAFQLCEEEGDPSDED
ncbi:hypothetical protein KP509_29G082300 [Ceratopteris richardii]|uniref:Uncharacterized protein n=1 Tax=Ceratopteris richardii TaxID=49495 RepID=A0A8T2RB00_CERRI|nr:hypothetical protein KP509_29G082300 [Ceratopteris richardii]